MVNYIVHGVAIIIAGYIIIEFSRLIIGSIKDMVQTIALVDDDRNILTGISIALEREGVKVPYSLLCEQYL